MLHIRITITRIIMQILKKGSPVLLLVLLMLYCSGVVDDDLTREKSTCSLFKGNVERTGAFDDEGPKGENVTKLWSFETGERRIEASPVVHDSVLYISSLHDYLYAIDIHSGKEIWHSDSTGFFRSSATISDDMIYIGNEDHHLYKFDTDGSIEWIFKTDGSVRASPLVFDNMVYFGSIDNVGYSRFAYKTDSVKTKSKFYALDAQTGEEVWSFSPEGGLRSSPAYQNGVLFFGSWDGTLYALDATNGDLKWSFETGRKIYSTPAVENNSVIFASNDDYLYSLNVENGSENWRFDLNSQNINEWIPRISSPAVSKNSVYIGSLNGTLYSVNFGDGSLIWSFETDDIIASSPSLTDDVVYFGSDDSYIYALQNSDGSLIWKYKANNSIGTSSPFIQNGRLFIGTTGNEIIALE